MVNGLNFIVAAEQKTTGSKLVALLRSIAPDTSVKGPFGSIRETLGCLSSGIVPDLVICDVNLGDGKSFDLFDHIRKDTPVVFLADSPDHAFEAFRFNSLGYLLKPVRSADVTNALNRFRKIGFASTLPATATYRTRFLIKTGNKLLVKNVEEASYFYAEGKLVYLVTRQAKRKYIVDYTLEELELSLDPKKFFRISRKYIVCVDCIEEVRGLISGKFQVKLLQPGEPELDVSRERAAEFKKWLDL